MQVVRPRQFGGSLVLAAEPLPLDQHIVAGNGIVGRPGHDLLQAAIAHSDRVAPAARDLVMTDHRERPPAQRMLQAIAQWSASSFAIDGLHTARALGPGTWLPAVLRQDPPHQFRLA
jgi:hypothetical protein